MCSTPDWTSFSSWSGSNAKLWTTMVTSAVATSPVIAFPPTGMSEVLGDRATPPARHPRSLRSRRATDALVPRGRSCESSVTTIPEAGLLNRLRVICLQIQGVPQRLRITRPRRIADRVLTQYDPVKSFDLVCVAELVVCQPKDPVVHVHLQTESRVGHDRITPSE